MDRRDLHCFGVGLQAQLRRLAHIQVGVSPCVAEPSENRVGRQVVLERRAVRELDEMEKIREPARSGAEGKQAAARIAQAEQKLEEYERKLPYVIQSLINSFTSTELVFTP